MKKSILLLTNIAVVAFASCGTLAEKNNEVSAVSLSEPNIAADGSEDSVYNYTMQDVQNLQNYLLSRPAEESLTGKPYDMNNDDCWDAFDLCLMRHKVQEDMNSGADNDTLVVYFSRTGNTEKIAEYLIELTHADSYIIEAAVPYTDADIKYQDNNCRANKEQNDKTVRPEIRSADTFIRIHIYEFPVIAALNVICIVSDLCFIRRLLFVRICRDSGVSCNFPFYRLIQRHKGRLI